MGIRAGIRGDPFESAALTEEVKFLVSDIATCQA